MLNVPVADAEVSEASVLVGGSVTRVVLVVWRKSQLPLLLATFQSVRQIFASRIVFNPI